MHFYGNARRGRPPPKIPSLIARLLLDTGDRERFLRPQTIQQYKGFILPTQSLFYFTLNIKIRNFIKLLRHISHPVVSKKFGY